MPFSIFGTVRSERKRKITVNNDDFFEKELQRRILIVFSKIVSNSSTTQNIISELIQIRYDISRRIKSNSQMLLGT
jgi:hypothetical protein